VIFFGSFTFKRNTFMLWHISDVHKHHYFTFQVGISVPYEKTYNWNLPVSHINYPNHFQVSTSLILPSYHCDSVIVVIMCRNCAFCWNYSTFCWHNFFSVNIKRCTEVDQQKFVEKIYEMAAMFYTNILCVTWSVRQVSYEPAV
jgi:hypothetical protein